jgi:hypothetical protein
MPVSQCEMPDFSRLAACFQLEALDDESEIHQTQANSREPVETEQGTTVSRYVRVVHYTVSRLSLCTMRR